MRLHDFLDYQARERPDAPFAEQGSRRITYREAGAEANRMANALAGAGLGAGERIAVLAKNSIEYALLYFAASKAGVVPVPLNTRLAPPEWAFIIADAGARLLLAGPEFVGGIDTVRDQLPVVERFIAFDAPGAAVWDDYRRWVAGFPLSAPDRTVCEEDDAYQMYTSGTTGRPKGTVVSHRAVAAQAFQITAALDAPAGERWLLVAPIFHSTGAAVGTFAGVASGGCIVIHADFNPVAVVRAFDEEAIASTILVPSMIQACLAVPGAAQRRYAGLRRILYGGSPIAEATLRRAIEVFGCDFIQGFGMTEMVGAITFLSAADHRRGLSEKPALLLSAGRPVLGVEMGVVDDQGKSLPAGDTGEIVVRGPNLMRGYWQRPDATADAIRDGWLHTGDAGAIDDDGYLYLLDRVKDMIVSGGENIYPREVEEALFGHPAVADAAVIGVPDPRWGETVKAIVVRRPDAVICEKEIVAFCRTKLGGYKVPRSVEFAESLPRNGSGKVLKRELRERYWAGQARRVAGA